MWCPAALFCPSAPRVPCMALMLTTEPCGLSCVVFPRSICSSALQRRGAVAGLQRGVLRHPGVSVFELSLLTTLSAPGERTVLQLLSLAVWRTRFAPNELALQPFSFFVRAEHTEYVNQ